MERNLCIPKTTFPMTEEMVWRWYLNVPQELEQAFLTNAEKAYLREYYHEAGLLRAWRRPFFRHHYARTFTQAVGHLFSQNAAPRILDLGCGMGTQTLLLALLGAEVIGLDLDQRALDILAKRKAFYEQHAGQTLPIRTSQTNVFEFDYASITPIDGIYSLFAFNLMLPSTRLLDTLFAHVSDTCCFAVLDGNNTCWASRLFPSRKRPDRLSPQQFESELEKRSFRVLKHTAGIVIPPIFWRVLPASVLRSIDTFLGKSWFLAISHQILARNGAGTECDY